MQKLIFPLQFMNEYLEKHQIYAMLQNAMEEVLVA